MARVETSGEHHSYQKMSENGFCEEGLHAPLEDHFTQSWRNDNSQDAVENGCALESHPVK